MKKPSSARRILPVAVAFGLAGTLAVPGTAPALAAAATPGGNAAFANPAHALGTGWRSSSDEVVTGVGDSDGFHILVSRERDAYQWTNLVTLDVPELDMGAWTGELCTTGDDKYAVVVYAPSAFSNHPELMEAGAFASVVNLATGAVTPVASGIQLAYHTPGCGAGDTAVLTRALGDNEQETQVLDVDAAAGKVTSVRTVRSQITNVVPTGSGDDGLVGGSLVHLNADGSYGKLATLPGAAYGLVTTSTGIDTVTVAGGKAVVDHWDGHSLRRLGTGDPHDLALFQQDGGGDLLVGAVGGITPAGTSMRTATATRAPDAVSRQGGLLVDAASDEEVAALSRATPGQSTPGALTGRIDITAHATGSAAPASGLLIANGPVATSTVSAQSPGAETAPQTDPSPAAGNVARLKPDATVPNATGSPGAVTPQSYHAGGANPAAADDDEIGVPLNTLDESVNPTCLIPRNSPTDQALQPTSQMVEWAADQESDNDLTVQRPTDFLGTQLPAYQPEQMFPLPTVAGETQVDIPAQVLLGIFDQESNFDQASWHAVAGDGGNPLISDYYGTAYDTKIADNDDVVPDYAHTDCGYGVGQVTSGMSSLDASPFTNQQATAVATDYAANVAASGQILAAMNPPMLVNDGNPTYIENWFMAIWGYNSGVYPESGQGSNGGYGVGWFNNPANPNYPADRSPFLDETTTMNDAANPQLWTYEEKVMGWIAYPQLNANGQRDFADPFFPSGVNDISTGKPTENLPMNTTAGGFYNWCTSANSCSSGSVSNPCPADSSACWWHLPVSWISNESSSNATVEGLDYALGSSEPAMVPKYAADCPNETAFKNQFTEAQRNVMVVPNLNDPSDNTRGCAWGASDGKFTLRLGDNVTLDDNLSNDMQANPLSAQIDTHQIGSGFLGHFYFTHSYDSGQTTIPISGGGTETYNGVASNSFVDGADNVLNTFVPSQVQHQVVGTWTPNITPGLSGEPYEIYLSIPDHGASEPHTVYHIDYGENAGSSQGSTTCAVSQSTGNNNNTWVLMGSFELYPGADVWLTNMLPGGNGNADVSYGAMVFVPVLGQPSNCVDSTANLGVS